MWFKYSIKLFVCFCCFLLGSGMSYAQGIADISHLDYETRSSIQIACAFAKTEGPASYSRCISKQLALLKQSPGIPDLSHLDYETRSSIQIACAFAKTEGPASYSRCISKQLASIGLSPKY